MAQENASCWRGARKKARASARASLWLEIETDKAVVEVEAPGDGILAGITADVGAVIPVGETIAWLVAPGEKPRRKWLRLRCGEGDERGASCCCGARRRRDHRLPAGVAAQISPKARRLAKELGVDIAQIQGTGLMARLRRRMCRPAANAKRGAAPAAAVGTIAAHER